MKSALCWRGSGVRARSYRRLGTVSQDWGYVKIVLNLTVPVKIVLNFLSFRGIRQNSPYFASFILETPFLRALGPTGSWTPFFRIEARQNSP